MEEKKQFKIWIPAAVLAALILALVGIAAAAGLFGGKKRLLINAVGNVVSQSLDAIGEVWGLNEYEDLFADGQLSMEANFQIGNGVEASMDISKDGDISGAAVDVGYSGSSLFQADLYIDKEEILLGAPKLTDTVFYVDRTNLEEDIEWLIEEYGLEADVADALKSLNEESRKDSNMHKELGEAMRRLVGAFSETYDKTKVEKIASKSLEVDGEERSCKGYSLTITTEQIQELSALVREFYGSNEAFQLYVDGMLSAFYGYSSQEEFLETYNPDELLADFENEIGEQGRQVTMTFYVYRKNLAKLLADLGDGITAEWNVYGGNFPLENTEIILTDGDEIRAYSRNGSRENAIYKAEYRMESDEDKTQLKLEYDTEKGGFNMEMSTDYGLYTLDYLLEGELDKAAPGSKLTVSIDTLEMNDTELLSGDITFSDEVGEIKKPEGEKRNVLRMERKDWYGLLLEISGNLY
ncbi:MAG: hypothetical protein NC400_02035 [Clostridium sp.]|nr:hypothetical protein [Clostridium sp.]